MIDWMIHSKAADNGHHRNENPTKLLSGYTDIHDKHFILFDVLDVVCRETDLSSCIKKFESMKDGKDDYMPSMQLARA